MNQSNRIPWPRWWYAIAFLVTLMALVALLSFPAHSAQAGLLDFIGEAASGIADATWKVVLIRAVQSSLTTIIFLVCVLGTIACAYGCAQVAGKFTELAKSALRDDKVTPSEKAVLAAVGLVDLGVVITLFWLAYFLMGAAAEIRA